MFAPSPGHVGGRAVSASFQMSVAVERQRAC
jgi:hypothetical protein